MNVGISKAASEIGATMASASQLITLGMGMGMRRKYLVPLPDLVLVILHYVPTKPLVPLAVFSVLATRFDRVRWHFHDADHKTQFHYRPQDMASL